MKNHLLFMAGPLLMYSLNAYSQANQAPRQAQSVNIIPHLEAKFRTVNQMTESTPDVNSTKPFELPQTPAFKSSAAQAQWDPISGSYNIYGVLVSNSKPLQYHTELNTVSFVHRGSKTYSPVPFPSPDPGATSGVIVADVMQNWSNVWDSTCVWNNNTNWARYPQGGIYNPPGNTNISSSYIVATGPVTNGSTWEGNFFASKKLDVFDNIASSTTDAQQFISSKTQTFGPAGKVDFARLDFASTSDGIVRSLGLILSTPDGGGTFEGARVMKGTFNSGVFNWTGDSLGAPVIFADNGTPRVIQVANMAWGENGSVGYVIFIGCRQGATGNNIGYQPIVWKSADGGNSWSLMSGIDFNDTTKFNAPVFSHMYATADDSTKAIPFFNFAEGIDCTVDKNDNLHIASTILSTANTASLGNVFTFTSSVDQETGGYFFNHDDPATMPRIYDFYWNTNGNSWDVAIIDTMTSEGPGIGTSDNGYAENPWDGDPASSNSKVSVDARIQMSRTPDGEFIVYTWAESDPQFTSGGKRWNQLPNIKARVMWVDSNKILSEQFDLTTGAIQAVKNKAHFLNTSPKCAVTASNTGNGTYTISLPVKITNSSPLQQLQPNTHWYSTAPIEFQISTGPGTSIIEYGTAFPVTAVYPNPSEGNVYIQADLKKEEKLHITVLNSLGQAVKTRVYEGRSGQSDVVLDLSGVTPGVYLLNIRTGEKSVTRKLIMK